MILKSTKAEIENNYTDWQKIPDSDNISKVRFHLVCLITYLIKLYVKDAIMRTEYYLPVRRHNIVVGYCFVTETFHLKCNYIEQLIVCDLTWVCVLFSGIKLGKDDDTDYR